MTCSGGRPRSRRTRCRPGVGTAMRWAWRNAKRPRPGDRRAIAQSAELDRRVGPEIGDVERQRSAFEAGLEDAGHCREQRRRLDDDDVGEPGPPAGQHRGQRERRVVHRGAHDTQATQPLDLEQAAAVVRRNHPVRIVGKAGEDADRVPPRGELIGQFEGPRGRRPDLRMEVVGHEQDAHGPMMVPAMARGNCHPVAPDRRRSTGRAVWVAAQGEGRC